MADAAPVADVSASLSVGNLTAKPLSVPRRGAAGKPRVGRQLDAGMASWYGRGFDGRRTASGENFDRDAFTAAHKTLPLGTRVVVRNPRNGKHIEVRINDRGPYTGDRIVDLSEAAARALGLKRRGRGWVVMHAVLPPSVTPNPAVDTAAQAIFDDNPAPPTVSSATSVKKSTVVPMPRLAAAGETPAMTSQVSVSIQ